MLTNQDLEILSGMVKNQLEKLILKRANDDTCEHNNLLDEEINRLYKLLSKVIILIEEKLNNYPKNHGVQDTIRINEPRILSEGDEFIRSLRGYWSTLTYAVNAAIQYTHDENSQRAKYDEICISLAQAIDNLRSYYINIKENPEDHGLYPFEPIKEIYQSLVRLGYGQSDQNVRDNARQQMVNSWQSMREPFLSEFNRAAPANPVSRYLSTEK